PTRERRAQFELVADHVAELPDELAAGFRAFFDAVEELDERALQAHFPSIFDQKRKCCPYLTHYATGDTRKRGMALVSFVEAYRAAGWELEEGELPDYLPVVLEFSARSDSPIAGELLASYRDGIEVLRAALDAFGSPYVHVVAAVSASLPEIDDETRERYLRLVNEGPPTELVGLSFLGNLEPYSPRHPARQEVGV